jgi:hypothetical protein
MPSVQYTFRIGALKIFWLPYSSFEISLTLHSLDLPVLCTSLLRATIFLFYTLCFESFACSLPDRVLNKMRGSIVVL